MALSRPTHMKPFSALPGLAGLLLSLAAPAQAPLVLPKPVAAALAGVRPGAIKAHIAYLADDRQRGRQPGTAGYQLMLRSKLLQMRESCFCCFRKDRFQTTSPFAA